MSLALSYKPFPENFNNHAPSPFSAAHKPLVKKIKPTQQTIINFGPLKQRSPVEEKNYNHFYENGFDQSKGVNRAFNLENGYKTISGFLTMLSVTEKAVEQMVAMTNLDMGNYEPLVILETIIAKTKKVFPVILDATEIIQLLIENNFVCIHSTTGLAEWAVFNKKNQPYMYISFKQNVNSNSTLITGCLQTKIADTIFGILEKQLVMPAKENVEISELTGYAETPNGFTGVYKTAFLNDEMDYSLPEFYPWILMDLQDYFKEFFASRSNVLVLIGPPGTGKSTMIRTMIRDLDINSLIAYKPDLIAAPHFITVCQNFLRNRNFIDDEHNLRSRAIIVEDADIIMNKRSDGNIRMAEILNVTSGITSDNENKFILSTNLKDIDDIDPALLRPGRCFDILCFRELTYDEAMLVRKVRGLPVKEMKEGVKYKLSEVLNDALTIQQVEPIIKPRFGFIK